MKANIRVLIAAAGKGARAGLPYPKTLFPIQGKPILLRIIELLSPYDTNPTVIVSPDGREVIHICLDKYNVAANLILQSSPKGMGDAVLMFEDSPAYQEADHVLLIWGDIPLIQPETVADMVKTHLLNNNVMTFPSRHVDSAYTRIFRDLAGQVSGVIETREEGAIEAIYGEREIGLFIFKKKPVFDVLKKESPNKWGQSTGEHGFLYVINELVEAGEKVEGLAIAQEVDLVSLNSLKDVDGYL